MLIHSRPKSKLISGLLCLALSLTAAAQDSFAEGSTLPNENPSASAGASVGETATRQLPEHFKITPPGHVAPLQFVVLMTVDAAVGPELTNEMSSGFNLSDARLGVRGALEGGFGYFAQAIFVQSPAILDAVIDWKAPEHGFHASVGYFRTPFSGELLVGAPVLDFINRSQIVRALAPARQVGIQLDQQIVGEKLVAKAGIFNGNGRNINDDDRFLYILRFDGRARCSDKTSTNGCSSVFEYGVNGAYSKDDSAKLGLGLDEQFKGSRWLGGADVRFTSGPVFVTVEALYGSINPSDRSRQDVYGYQLSTGWNVTPIVQLLARYDALYAGSLRSDRDLAITSVNLNFTDYISLQVELRVPTRGEDAKPGGVANLNLTF
ncbi:MAG: hypothetical protein ACI8W3_003603 [Myxococcota bacterium]|jgi:hypothetical protein